MVIPVSFIILPRKKVAWEKPRVAEPPNLGVRMDLVDCLGIITEEANFANIFQGCAEENGYWLQCLSDTRRTALTTGVTIVAVDLFRWRRM